MTRALESEGWTGVEAQVSWVLVDVGKGAANATVDGWRQEMGNARCPAASMSVPIGTLFPTLSYLVIGWGVYCRWYCRKGS